MPENKNLCFVDTNIWLYSFIKTQNSIKHEIAQKIIKENNIIVSERVINETSVNLLKKANFSESRIRELIRAS